MRDIKVGTFRMYLFCEECNEEAHHTVLSREDKPDDFICQGYCGTYGTEVTEAAEFTPKGREVRFPIEVLVTDHLTVTQGWSKDEP